MLLELTKRGALAAVLSVVVNLVVLQAVLATGGVPRIDPLSVPPVTLFTILGVVGATAVYGLLVRFSGRPDRTFLIVAAVVLLLSFVPDVGLLQVNPAATVRAVVVLMVMHVTVAAICVWVLTDRYSPLGGRVAG